MATAGRRSSLDSTHDLRFWTMLGLANGSKNVPAIVRSIAERSENQVMVQPRYLYSVVQALAARGFVRTSKYGQDGRETSVWMLTQDGREFFARLVEQRKWEVQVAMAAWRERGVLTWEYARGVPPLDDEVILAVASGDILAEAEARAKLGKARLGLGDANKAALELERARVLFRGLSNREGEQRVLRDLGTLSWRLGNFEEARQHFNDSRRLNEEALDWSMWVKSTKDLAGVALDNRQPELALDLSNQALARIDQGYEAQNSGGESYDRAATAKHQGLALLALGRDDDAYGVFTRAAELARSIRDWRAEAANLLGKATIEYKRGDHEVAAVTFDNVLEVIRDEFDLDDAKSSVEESHPERFARNEPSNHVGRLYAAVAYLASGGEDNVRRGLSILEEASQMAPLPGLSRSVVERYLVNLTDLPGVAEATALLLKE